jgi:hypothetical protein
MEEDMKKVMMALTVMTLALLLVTSLAVGQGRGAGRGEPGFAASDRSIVLQGIVESTDMLAGQGTPSFVLISNGVSSTILVRSFRRVADGQYEIQPGDEVEVVAFPSRRDERTFVAASVKNLKTGDILEFGNRGPRSFRGRAGGAPFRGQGPCPQSFNAEEVVILTGLVAEAQGLTPGGRFPSVKLNTGETIMVGPYRVLADAGFEMKQGDAILVRAFPSVRNPGAFIALSIENQTSGTSVVLRGEDGFPAAGARGQGRRGGRFLQ